MLDHETAMRVGAEASTAIGDAMCEWTDSRAALLGCSRGELIAVVGKSLIIEGTTMIGTAIGCEFEEAIEAARKSLNELKRLAAAKKMRLALDDIFGGV